VMQYQKFVREQRVENPWRKRSIKLNAFTCSWHHTISCDSRCEWSDWYGSRI